MNKADNHNIESRIDAYRAGRLSEEEVDLLWAELMEYPEHMEYLVNSVNLEAIAADEKQKSTAGAKVTKLYQLSHKWSRIAAVLLVGVGLLSTAWFWSSDYVTESGPIADIELDNFRSSTIPTAVFDYQVQRAINLAALEQFEDAIDKLEEIEENILTQDQQVSLQLNKGSVYYNKGDYHAAQGVFQDILNQNDELHILTEEQIHWFLGNTYLQLGNKELAQEHIQKTYDLNGAYRRLAERYLE